MNRILSFICLLAVMNLVHAEEPAQQLQQLLSQTNSFSADFHQRVVSEEGELLQESRGDIVLQRPYQMHWQTLEPFRYQVVTDGKTLWRYDPDLEQLNTEAFSENLANTPVMVLVSATDQVARQFTVTREVVEEGQRFTLVPRDETTFTELTLLFKEGVLNHMRLQDHLGQETSIELDNAKVNVGYPEEHFVFSSPETTGSRISLDDFGLTP